MKLVRCPNYGFVCKKNGKTNACSQRWYCNQCSCSFTNKVNKTNHEQSRLETSIPTWSDAIVWSDLHNYDRLFTNLWD